MRYFTPAQLYWAYPHSDLLPMEPPSATKTWKQFVDELNKNERIPGQSLGDTLFLFLARELARTSGDQIDSDEQLRRIKSAIEQLDETLQDLRKQTPAKRTS